MALCPSTIAVKTIPRSTTEPQPQHSHVPRHNQENSLRKQSRSPRFCPAEIARLNMFAFATEWEFVFLALPHPNVVEDVFQRPFHMLLVRLYGIVCHGYGSSINLEERFQLLSDKAKGLCDKWEARKDLSERYPQWLACYQSLYRINSRIHAIFKHTVLPGQPVIAQHRLFIARVLSCVFFEDCDDHENTKTLMSRPQDTESSRSWSYQKSRSWKNQELLRRRGFISKDSSSPDGVKFSPSVVSQVNIGMEDARDDETYAEGCFTGRQRFKRIGRGSWKMTEKRHGQDAAWRGCSQILTVSKHRQNTKHQQRRSAIEIGDGITTIVEEHRTSRFHSANGSLISKTELEIFLCGKVKSQRGWHVERFLHRSNYADVYALRNIDAHTDELQAHVFFGLGDAKAEKYKQRKKKRLKENGNCLDTFWCDDRQIFILRVPRPAIEFRLHSSAKSFPALVEQTAWCKKEKERQQQLRRQPTYAAVLKGTDSRSFVTYGTRTGSCNDALVLDETTRLQLISSKKRAKQKSKRQLHRQYQRECEVLEVLLEEYK